MASHEPIAWIRTAGLRYVSDTQPGIRRQRAGKGFRYIGVDGTTIRDTRVLQRIKVLVIPPAWVEIWICPRPDGHLQATGRDAMGRKQYHYHPHWRAVRDATELIGSSLSRRSAAQGAGRVVLRLLSGRRFLVHPGSQ